ncbi:MAG: M3 family oligoendopeptidase [Rickettsiales bacterium]
MTEEAYEELPQWDLSDFYSSIDDPKIEIELTSLGNMCRKFVQDYEGKVNELNVSQLALAISEYEMIQELFGKIGSFASLVFAKNMSLPQNVRFYQNIQERLTELSSSILFFILSINKIADDRIDKKLKESELSKYSPWLRDIRALKPYQLSDELEKILLEKSVTGGSAWVRLFDETISDMRFPYDGKELTEPEIFNKLSAKGAATRQKAALVIGDVFAANSKIFTMITNVLAKDKEVEDRWRKFPSPISARNISNYIEDEVVEALISSVRSSYGNLSHRYYALKAKWFGKEQLDYWDRNAPLPKDIDRKYSWQEAKELVLSSYNKFSPHLATIGKNFFDKSWIDAPVLEGKSPGAFAHPTVPSVHPYLLLNFQGKSRDVMTLAHELGHGVHQMLSAKQGALMCDTPLTLAETASVFGEQLTFREIVNREEDAERRKYLIAAKVEDMLNTVVRQIAFCEFERVVHDERKNGELSAQRICDIWMATQSESLGEAISLHGNYQYFWTYIPHFIHTPFYVYAYAFGDCLVNSLYAVYESGSVPDFEKKYLSMLESGGTLRHKELLAPFGLDASNPEFWKQGLNVISSMINELEG